MKSDLHLSGEVQSDSNATRTEEPVESDGGKRHLNLCFEEDHGSCIAAELGIHHAGAIAPRYLSRDTLRARPTPRLASRVDGSPVSCVSPLRHNEVTLILSGVGFYGVLPCALNRDKTLRGNALPKLVNILYAVKGFARGTSARRKNDV